MGYTTHFCGAFTFDKELSNAHFDYLMAFSKTKRYKRDAAKTSERADVFRIAVGLPVGIEGEQPGLWCSWEPTSDRKGLHWNGQEKFYDYIEWLEYITRSFLKPWGYTLSGNVSWIGEDLEDSGVISVVNGLITIDEQELHSESVEVIEFRDAMFLLEELDLETQESLENIERIARAVSGETVSVWLYQPAIMFLYNQIESNDDEAVRRGATDALKKIFERDFVIPDTVSNNIRFNSTYPLFNELNESLCRRAKRTGLFY